MEFGVYGLRMHSRRSYSPLEIRKRRRNTVRRRDDFDGTIVMWLFMIDEGKSRTRSGYSSGFRSRRGSDVTCQAREFHAEKLKYGDRPPCK